MKIEKLPSGTYRTRVYIGKRDGKSVYKSLTHQDPRRLRVLAAEYAAAGHDPEETAGSIGALIDAYITAKSAILSPSTVRGYISMSKSLKASNSGFCGLSASTMRKKDLQGLVNELHAAGRSAKYIKNLISLISSALTYHDYTAPSVTLPAPSKPPAELPADIEILKLILYADAHGLDDLLLAVCLALFCGLRRSEICALEVSDFNDTSVTISKALVRGPDRRWILKGTKTSQSARVIPVPDDIRDAIRGRSGRIFSCTPGALVRRFDRAIAAAGVKPFRFHALRHKFASDLMLQGVPDVYIEYLGGWKHGSQVLKTTYQQAEREKAAEMLRRTW